MFVYILATLDTKGSEAEFVRQRLNELGVPTKLVDTGCLGETTVPCDVSREEIFQAAGTTLAAMRSQGDRGVAISRAAEGAASVVRRAYHADQLAGVIALGGSAGTTIGTAAMRALPLGVPKVMVSTLASGQTRPYVRDKDIFLLNSVVDIAGINRISRAILGEAAAAMAGLVKFRASDDTGERKKTIAATMFGVTTPCVQRARQIFEEAGYEVLVFHATGNGGEAMESLITEGLIDGVLDITTTELADELVGGVLSAGPTRLTAAARVGVPQVVSVGALDMVNFGPRETVPAKFASRKFHQHNANVTLMRTTVEENAQLGAEIGCKVAESMGPVALLLPLQGVSALDREGQSFNDPAARSALFQALKQSKGTVELVELDCHINDAQFAETAANKLLHLLSIANKGS